MTRKTVAAAVSCVLAVFLLAVFLLAVVSFGYAQEMSTPQGIESLRPKIDLRGFPSPGGHSAYHHQLYDGLKNRWDQDCCHDTDCRPTKARPIGNGLWEFLINGKWIAVGGDYYITDGMLKAQGKERPDGLAHICAAMIDGYPGHPAGYFEIYCAIPPEGGN